jgi:O-acetyl-ADP-ribose deacetylase (regulator of RNase III)
MSSMRNAFALASENEIATIAIPAVGTGIAGFPMDECARVMAESLSEALSHGWQPQEVRFVLFGEDSRGVFEVAFQHVFNT